MIYVESHEAIIYSNTCHPYNSTETVLNGSCHHGMERIEETTSKTAANISNRRSRKADKGWSFRIGVG